MVEKLFEKYKPIKAIYETSTEYICFPETKNLEPLAVYYDKNLKSFNEVYFFQKNTIAEDIEDAELVFGHFVNFSENY